ncbi:MAG TPA: exonuclease SbcCD subunit D C-terminal domain-containing protein [Sporichthya sp.]|nr:exonuclease SbcCD subunit D C-terminal domain-containing protein [Sporichthya sp.]
MRLLHTSDWHLGRSLHRADLASAQGAFLDHLVDTVRSERVDAVLVSGDVYDRALPPVEAVDLLNDALYRLREAGARVIVTSGNHDSAKRLGVHDRLVDAAGVHLRTRVAEVATPVVLEDGHGPVAVYAVPYLEPAAVGDDDLPEVAPGTGHSCDEETPSRGHAHVLGRAMTAVRADLARRGGRSVVMAHGWVTGGAACESERDITVGGINAVSGDLFDGVDYVALGHLHSPQVLSDRLRYSGSPLAYSFSEAAHTKGSWLVELGTSGLSRVEFVPAPPTRRMTALSGTLEVLLADPALEPHVEDYVAVTLIDPVRPAAAMDRLRTRFPHVLVLTWAPVGSASDDRAYSERVRGRSDLDVAADFVAHVRGTAAGTDEVDLLEKAFEAVRIADDADPFAKPGTLFEVAAAKRRDGSHGGGGGRSRGWIGDDDNVASRPPSAAAKRRDGSQGGEGGRSRGGIGDDDNVASRPPSAAEGVA